MESKIGQLLGYGLYNQLTDCQDNVKVEMRSRNCIPAINAGACTQCAEVTCRLRRTGLEQTPSTHDGASRL